MGRSRRYRKLHTPQGWKENKDLVLEFYNIRRKQLTTVHPNKGHLALTELEKI
ncbi:MAG: hypothetical protein R2771_03165 [Saprospiraceae bacterium]